MKVQTTLGIKGERFTVGGSPTLLYGVSYYGALGASPDTLRRDLDEMPRHGFNWFRVWANWAAFDNDVSAVGRDDGGPREPFLTALGDLISECDGRGLIVDVTLSRGNGITGPPRLQTHAAHRKAVETLVTTLQPWRNWYLDLSNERSLRDQRFTSYEELTVLRAAVRALDPDRLVTASHVGDLPPDEVDTYLNTVGVDFLAPHLHRNGSAPALTEAKTRASFNHMRALGRIVPVHYQEPFRRGFGTWQATAEDFATDLRGAIAGGAAGWCFHNGDERAQDLGGDGRPRRSFDLRDGSMFDQLDAEERRALPLLQELSAQAKNL
jgi:hypothetical protein